MGDLPVGLQSLLWVVIIGIGIFGFMLMIVVYEAAQEAKEFFKRANAENRQADADAEREP